MLVSALNKNKIMWARRTLLSTMPFQAVHIFIVFHIVFIYYASRIKFVSGGGSSSIHCQCLKNKIQRNEVLAPCHEMENTEKWHVNRILRQTSSLRAYPDTNYAKNNTLIMMRELNFGGIIRIFQRLCETDQNIIVSALIMTNYDGNAFPLSPIQTHLNIQFEVFVRETMELTRYRLSVFGCLSSRRRCRRFCLQQHSHISLRK